MLYRLILILLLNLALTSISVVQAANDRSEQKTTSQKKVRVERKTRTEKNVRAERKTRTEKNVRAERKTRTEKNDRAERKTRTEKNDRAEKKTRVEKKRTISKSSAINVAKSQVRGKVLSAKLISSKGPAVYRVKMYLDDGRVRTVFVDGDSGRVIQIN